MKKSYWKKRKKENLRVKITEDNEIITKKEKVKREIRGGHSYITHKHIHTQSQTHNTLTYSQLQTHTHTQILTHTHRVTVT